MAENTDDDDTCPYCGDGDRVPYGRYWVCPVCDAEWVPDETVPNPEDSQ